MIIIKFNLLTQKCNNFFSSHNKKQLKVWTFFEFLKLKINVKKKKKKKLFANNITDTCVKWLKYKLKYWIKSLYVIDKKAMSRRFSFFSFSHHSVAKIIHVSNPSTRLFLSLFFSRDLINYRIYNNNNNNTIIIRIKYLNELRLARVFLLYINRFKRQIHFLGEIQRVCFPPSTYITFLL